VTVREATEAERVTVAAPPGGRVLVCDGDDGIDGAIAGDVVDGVAYVSLAWGERAVRAALLRELAGWFRERGAKTVHVVVEAEDAPDWEALGFTETRRELAGPLETLERRVAERASEPSFGSIHVQSDDHAHVERAVREYVPRLPGRSRGTRVASPRNGWIAVYDELCDRNPQMLRRLARELSDRLGAVVLAIGVEEGAVVRFVLYQRGRVMDEYLSIQEFYGPIPPGDMVALAANPAVVARLTGADPAALRAAAVHGASPAELPPPTETIAALGRAMGIEGVEHGHG
jgi:hypothetical protein